MPVPIKCHIRAVQIDDENFSLKEQSREFGYIVLSDEHATATFSMGGKRRRFVASNAQACVDAIGWFQKGDSAIRDTESELENTKSHGLSVTERYFILQKLPPLDDDLKRSTIESYTQQEIRNLESKLANIKQKYMSALESINGTA